MRKIKKKLSNFLITVANLQLNLNLEAGKNENEIYVNNPLMGAGSQPPVSYQQYRACQGNYNNILTAANNYCVQIRGALDIAETTDFNDIIDDGLERLGDQIDENRKKYEEALENAIKGDPDEMMIAEKGKEYAKEEKKKIAKMKVMKGKKGKK